jgi:hypothetical protein
MTSNFGKKLLFARVILFIVKHQDKQRENKLIFNEMMMESALYKTNMLNWILIVLAHWKNTPRIDMSTHSDILSWFRVNQSFSLADTNFIGSGFTRSAIEHTIYRTRGERSVHYTTDAYIYLYFLQYVMKKYKLST